MEQAHHIFEIATHGPGLVPFTSNVQDFVASSSINKGGLTLRVQHTSASLVIQENADPDVRDDLEDFFKRIVSRDQSLYRHTMEGADDMPAHIRSALTATSLSIPIINARVALGTWQGVYLYEHRDRGSLRRVVGHIIGD